MRFFIYYFLFFPLLGWCANPEKKNSVENIASPRLEYAALQIALDNEGFLPGVIDGREGIRTAQALKLAKQAGREILRNPDAWNIWKIPKDFLKDISPVPSSWLARSKLGALNHESSMEKLAETFHLSQDFLQYLNPKIQDWNLLKEEDSIKIPILAPRRLPSADHLRVSLSNKVIIACDDHDKILASFPCSIAAKKEKRPVGKLEIRVLAPKPDYLFDPLLFPENPESATIKTKLMIPPGPNNPVGEMWIGLNLKGYGIHGTPWPEDIGKTESHGCFRLSNWDAKRLAGIVRIGTAVYIDP